jgi:glucose 1-dehydrogenase
MTHAAIGVLAGDALARKVGLVTGAAKGIGRGAALALAHAGADVAINDITLDHHADTTAASVGALGRRATLHQADVSQRDAVERMVAEVVAAHGRLDILVSNAGIHLPRPFLEITDDVMQREIDVDLKGVILCGQAAARQMVRQGGGGAIVNISSIHAIDSYRHAAIYDACKAGVLRLTATMALELAEHRIRVNAIGPGWVDTPLNTAALDTPEKRATVSTGIPLGRVGEPEEIGTLAAFLCSPAAAYITGSFVLIDGGLLLRGA